MQNQTLDNAISGLHDIENFTTEALDLNGTNLKKSPPSPTDSEVSTTGRKAWGQLKRIVYGSQFWMQVFLTLLIMIWSVVMLTFKIAPDSERTVYFSLISGLIGYWLPSPKLKVSDATTTSTTNSK